MPVRKILPHTAPQWVPDASWYFITIKCAPPGKNQLTRDPIGHALLSSIAHNHKKLAWHCRLCLLMPDHLHAILAFPPEPGMKKTVTDWKRYVARHFAIKWHRDFFDHRLRNDQEITKKTSYILMNPIRKGLCDQPENWPWIYRPNNRLPPT